MLAFCKLETATRRVLVLIEGVLQVQNRSSEDHVPLICYGELGKTLSIQLGLLVQANANMQLGAYLEQIAFKIELVFLKIDFLIAAYGPFQIL